MLFVQGSRDAFGTPAELEPFVTPLASRGTRIFAIEGGDHSLVPPKSSGLDIAQVTARVADESCASPGDDDVDARARALAERGLRRAERAR